MKVNLSGVGVGFLDTSNLIPDAAGNLFDVLTGRVYYEDPVTGLLEETGNGNAAAMAATRKVVAVQVPQTQSQVAQTQRNANPAVAPGVSTNRAVVMADTLEQARLSRTVGDWSTSVTIWPSVQRQLGVNNLTFSVVAAMLGATLVLVAGGSGYTAYRYSRR